MSRIIVEKRYIKVINIEGQITEADVGKALREQGIDDYSSLTVEDLNKKTLSSQDFPRGGIIKITKVY
jgi:hypothetical protein